MVEELLDELHVRSSSPSWTFAPAIIKSACTPATWGRRRSACIRATTSCW
jgi:hypothetical protein